jgi:hypothetical protein
VSSNGSRATSARRRADPCPLAARNLRAHSNPNPARPALDPDASTYLLIITVEVHPTAAACHLACSLGMRTMRELTPA